MAVHHQNSGRERESVLTGAQRSECFRLAASQGTLEFHVDNQTARVMLACGTEILVEGRARCRSDMLH